MAADRFLYTLSQSARVSWYLAQYLISARLTSAPKISRRIEHRIPEIKELLAELRELFRRDWRNIELGYYRQPHDVFEPPQNLIADAIRYFSDLPSVDRRRRRGRHDEVVASASGPDVQRFPRYYLQNFHYQTDGYLSARSARLYDHQVNVLFFGGANVMLRQALVPIYEFLKGRPAAGIHLIDAGCGTGRFLTFVKDNYPEMNVTAIDLSPHYLRQARRALGSWPEVAFLEANVESIPLEDESADLMTCIYLAHELPKQALLAAAKEFARVLRRGGRLILLDSLQSGDVPFFEGLIEFFPQAYHEPYYEDYLRTDFVRFFGGVGLSHLSTDFAFSSKVMVFEK